MYIMHPQKVYGNINMFLVYTKINLTVLFNVLYKDTYRKHASLRKTTHSLWAFRAFWQLVNRTNKEVFRFIKHNNGPVFNCSSSQEDWLRMHKLNTIFKTTDSLLFRNRYCTFYYTFSKWKALFHTISRNVLMFVYGKDIYKSIDGRFLRSTN